MNQSFQVQGMTCGHCVKAVTEAVKTLDPKAEVQAYTAERIARVERVLQHIDRHRLMAAPDCGLIMLPRDAAIAKLRNLAQAAHSL